MRKSLHPKNGSSTENHQWAHEFGIPVAAAKALGRLGILSAEQLARRDPDAVAFWTAASSPAVREWQRSAKALKDASPPSTESLLPKDLVESWIQSASSELPEPLTSPTPDPLKVGRRNPFGTPTTP